MGEQKKKIRGGISGLDLGFTGFRVEITPFLPKVLGQSPPVGPKCARSKGKPGVFGDCRMTEREPAGERRKWSRLPLGIPVFVRSRDDKGNECLEFATSLNVSAGGMLLAVRRPLRPTDPLRLEIPSAPVAATAMASVARTLEGRALRVAPSNGYYLLGIKFLRPLSLSNRASRKRKLVSSL